MRFIKLLYALSIFVVLLIAIYCIHINFFYVDVVLYSAILDSILAALTTTLFLWFSDNFKIFSPFEKFQIFIIFILIGYSLAISIPAVIDRSLSFYILEKIQENGGGIKKSSFEEIFKKDYVKDHRLIEVRITEQLESGTIKIKNNCVKLTKFGNTLANLSKKFRINFLPKKRLLSGNYTNELTNIPKIENQDYKNSTIYRCN